MPVFTSKGSIRQSTYPIGFDFKPIFKYVNLNLRQYKLTLFERKGKLSVWR